MPTRVRVGVGELIGASKSYLEAQVKKANLNGNAYLTLEEAKKLPADLRDNYESFRKAGNARVSVKQFRTAALSHRDAAGQASVRRAMEAEAANWSPTNPEWEKIENGGNTSYAGRFFQLYTEVTFKPGVATPAVYVEID